MSKAAGFAIAVSGADAGTAIRDALERRIGADRFAVWFGDSMRVAVASATAGRGPEVTVHAGTGFTHDWLRRTFHHDVEAVAAEICGRGVPVAWEAIGNAAAIAAPPRADLPSPSVRHPRPRPRGVESAAAAAASPPRRPVPGLDAFVVGPSNRMARAAVERAVAGPGEMSPLVIHGPSGVGKTHLLEAACVRTRDLHPGMPVVFLSAEQFTTGFLQSLHGSGLPGFRRTCRGAGLLAIDDIQFLVGKRATLLEFQHTVDALHREGRQMVFACDRELDALPGLGPELLTRLRGGMTARIQPPDYDVRRGIVAATCAARGLEVPDEVVHYVATHMTRHARELHGAVNRLEATSLMLGLPIDAGMAGEALCDLVRASSRSVRLADVDRAVCRAFGIEEGSLQSSRRARHASHARMLAMFLARKHTHAALAEIGRHFGRRSHSTVIAAQKAVAGWLAARDTIVIADSRWDVDEALRRVEDLLRAG
ncbi:MAG: DnaA ATPase domain-containing protein [Planctomycetaceae bacterium]